MKMHGVLQEFETYDEALDFLYKTAKEYDLSYIPKEQKKDILQNALASAHMDVICKDIDWGSSDIRNRLNKLVGEGLLQYMEWKIKNYNQNT